MLKIKAMSQYSMQIRNSLISALIVWTVPFLISLLFYTKDGLNIDIFLFKSIMIVAGALSGAFVMIWFFKDISAEYLRAGVIFGAIVLPVNWILDIAVLCVLLGSDIMTWFAGVGIRYLIIPVMSIAAGCIADNADLKKR